MAVALAVTQVSGVMHQSNELGHRESEDAQLLRTDAPEGRARADKACRIKGQEVGQMNHGGGVGRLNSLLQVARSPSDPSPPEIRHGEVGDHLPLSGDNGRSADAPGQHVVVGDQSTHVGVDRDQVRVVVVPGRRCGTNSDGGRG